MGNVNFNIEHKRVLDSFLLEIPGVVSGKCSVILLTISIRNYLLASMRMEWVLRFQKIKQMNLLVKKGIIHFQPLGRAKMRVDSNK
ncbi:MAG: hypothetical protein ACXVZU_05225 [Methanobacteriaceae archaeon]